jgi:hypothetical protein
MAAYTELPITDPDELGFSVHSEVTFATAFTASVEELVINTTTKSIGLKVQGNLDQDGATAKAVYSKLKDAWRTNTTLIKFPFPVGPITDEQFEMVNGWNWDKVQTSGAATQTTVELIRTGGWSVVSGGVDLERWTNVITLGSLGSTDQVYYQQVGADEAPANFKLTGKVNQAIQVWSDPNGDGNTSDGYNRTSYLKIFVREWEKLFAQSEIFDIGVATILSQAYRYPLTNSADLKISVTDANIVSQLDANSDGTPDLGVYANVKIDYLRHSGGSFYNVRGDFAAATVYIIGDVTKDTGNNRWYKCIVGYTSTGTLPSANATNWAVYEGERLIGSNYYPYTIIIDGDNGVVAGGSGAARTQQIYTAVQYFLKQNIDIDEGTGAVTGKTASSLLRFVGDTLVTSPGVYVDSFNAQDTNSITFTDALGSARTYPYVAALTVNFGPNLQDDQYSKYWVFFTNDDAGSNTGRDFATTTAIIVKDADGVDCSGDVNIAWPTKRTAVSHTYNFDSNDQRGAGTYNSGDGVGDSAKTNAPITVVGIGLRTGQYVLASGLIEKSTANSVTLTSSLERNYSQGTTYP